MKTFMTLKIAMKGDQFIDLETIDRASYQRIYEEGKKGQLMCPVCHEPVRLILGIEYDPYFKHTLKKNNHCQFEMASSEIAVSIETEKQINGFRLPKARTISETNPKQKSFKSAKQIKQVPVFNQHHKEKPIVRSPFIETLQQHHIYLDHNQIEAVIHPNGALLVLSGAGSGKTRVLTSRTAFLLSQLGVEANRIMLVTFTAKAAKEMNERLLNYPSINKTQIRGIVSGTFHSLFYRILNHHQPQKWNGQKLLNKEWQRRQILKEAGKQLDLDEKEFAYDAALQQIGLWKNSLLSPNQIVPTTAWEEKSAFLFKKYEEFKQQQELFDFDDMLVGCYELFLHDEKLLHLYQNRFDYFLIDEFQDVNKVQYELIKLLSNKHKNVFVVGDDDQAIYAFRGSNPQYLREFEKDFPHAEVVQLNENYRSSHDIVSVANLIISENKHRRPKKMYAQYTKDKKPTLFFPYDEEEEATMIVTDISEKIEQGADPNDFAILFRTNTSSRAIFERLTNSSLPFIMDQDIESFYERFIVRCMLGFLALSLNEDDSTAMSDIFPALFLKQSMLNDMKADSILNDCTLLQCLNHVKTNFAFQEKKLKKVLPVVRSLSSLSPLEAINKVEKDLNFQEFLKKRGNEGNQFDKGSDDLRDLKVAAKNFTTIQEFLQHTNHMAAMNKEIKKQSKQRKDGITLSTIHRSKGLEYKIVYIIGSVDGSLPHDFALESLREGDLEPLEEERRLLYVAVTRAKEALYLSVPQHWRGKKAKPSRFLTKFR
ncbi:ATP-dependent helicase [Niallia sp. Krafla_26]|uniref:ATP-dependent helicase n=1 Tax=Niallia sp. Krafla_26 TaxID=3064703 RepID=UPI003D177502